MKILILLFGIFFNAAASILIKLGVSGNYKLPSLNEPLLIFGNWPILAGICCYSIAFLIYIIALSLLPLNIAHPTLTAGAIAIVSSLSVIIFKENFDWKMGIGILFIIIGVLLLTIRQNI